MASTAAIEQLAGQVKGLSLDSVSQTYANAHPDVNPLDLWRAHISNVLAEIAGVDPAIIFPVIAWTQSLDKGDFTLPVPALRIKGSKPDVLATEWASKVRRPDPLSPSMGSPRSHNLASSDNAPRQVARG